MIVTQGLGGPSLILQGYGGGVVVVVTPIACLHLTDAAVYSAEVSYSTPYSIELTVAAVNAAELDYSTC